VDVKLRAPRRPEPFRGSDLGARLTGRLGGWDLGLSYLWHHDDAPALRRRVRFVDFVPTVDVEPTYERTQVMGVTASNSFGNLTLRIEAAYTSERWMPSDDADDHDGTVSTSELGAVLGLDWYGFRDT